MIADHEQRADRVPFAPFAADVDRQIDDDLERLERNPRLQLPQIAHVNWPKCSPSRKMLSESITVGSYPL